jgi:hypothetical protein
MVFGNASAGDMVVKIGATIGITGGTVNGTRFYTYFWGAELLVRLLRPPTLMILHLLHIPVDHTILTLIFPNQPQQFCARGDSGTGVFKFDGGTCSWAVTLVGIDHPDRQECQQRIRTSGFAR